MKYLLPLIVLVFNVSAVDVTIVWNAAPPEERPGIYLLQESISNRWEVIAQTTNTIYTLTNYNASNPRSFSVTFSNVLGIAAPPSDALIAPRAPSKLPPPRLAKMEVNTSLPGMIEMSNDLVDWKQFISIAPDGTNGRVTVAVYPEGNGFFIKPNRYAIPSVIYPSLYGR